MKFIIAAIVEWGNNNDDHWNNKWTRWRGKRWARVEREGGKIVMQKSDVEIIAFVSFFTPRSHFTFIPVCRGSGCSSACFIIVITIIFIDVMFHTLCLCVCYRFPVLFSSRKARLVFPYSFCVHLPPLFVRSLPFFVFFLPQQISEERLPHNIDLLLAVQSKRCLSADTGWCLNVHQSICMLLLCCFKINLK